MSKYAFGDIAINSTEKRTPTEADMETYIGLEHLDAGSLTIKRWGSKVPIKGDKTVMRKGDVLFGKRNAYLRRAAVCPHDGLFSAHGMVLRPKTEVIDRDFFPLFIASDYFFDAAIRISVGSLSPTVNWSDLKKLEFSLPPLDEQRKLAQVLWSVIELKEAYQKLLTRCDEMASSRFIELFGEKQYPKFTLIELIEPDAGLSYGIVQPGDDGTGDMGVLRPVDLVDGRISTSNIKYVNRNIGDGYKRTELNGKEILISVRGTTGLTAITDSRFIGMNVTRGIAVIRFDERKVNSIFLNSALNELGSQAFIQEHTRGATLKQINLTDLRRLPISLPPLALQNEFAAFIEELDKSKVELQKSIASLEVLMKTLSQDISN